MKQVISRNGALKTFYYLMAIDGDVTAEIDKFNEIGRDFLKEEFDNNRQQIIDECCAQIDSAVVDDELYDVIQEGVDKALGETVNKVEDGVCPRLLIWDMLSIAYTDNEYSEPEKRMIAHVARLLDVQKDVVMEMEHLMKTADAVIKELETLNSSNKPYSEIRPTVDEIEKRKQTITKAAEELIADDFVLERPQKEHKVEEQSNVFSEAGKMISDTLNPVVDQVGDFAKKTFSDAKDLVDKIDTKEISEGAGKLFSKMKGMIGKNTGFHFPSDYSLVKKDESLDVGAPKSTWVFNKTSVNTEAEVFSVKVSKREAMDFDNPQALIDDLHGQTDDFSGLIEVKAGRSKNSSKYIYFIKKFSTDPGQPHGNSYLLSLNIQVGAEIYFVLGCFKEIGITGMRESMVSAMMMSNESVERESNGMIKGWSRDPYDENFKTGFLMNLAEGEQFDPQFPEHPLSELRSLKNYIINNN